QDASRAGDSPSRTQQTPGHWVAGGLLLLVAGSAKTQWSGAEILQDLTHELGGLRRCLADLDSSGLEGLLLGRSRAGGPGDDGASVPHRLTLGGGETGDIADHW